MEEKTATVPTCFLVDHGDFYGKEITNGILFVSDRQTGERKLIETVRPGNLFFHCSPSGLSALSRATTMPLRVPFPFWRCREGKPGDRGYAVETEVFLLPRPMEAVERSGAYLSLLNGEEAARLLREIAAAEPEVAGEEWFRSVCNGFGI